MGSFIIPVALKPFLDLMFGLGAIAMFGEIIMVLHSAISIRFTIGRITELVISSFLFVICLDWTTGFYFFENTIAPLVWNTLNSK